MKTQRQPERAVITVGEGRGCVVEILHSDLVVDLGEIARLGFFGQFAVPICRLSIALRLALSGSVFDNAANTSTNLVLRPIAADGYSPSRPSHPN